MARTVTYKGGSVEEAIIDGRLGDVPDILRTVAKEFKGREEEDTLNEAADELEHWIDQYQDFLVDIDESEYED